MRSSLLLGFGAVLVLMAAGIISNNLYAQRKVVRELSQSILQQTTQLAKLKLDGFFGLVSGISSGTAARLDNGLLEWQEWDSFRRFLLPLMNRVPQVSGVGAGDGEGNAYNLVRFGTLWRSQEVRPGEWGRDTLWKEWTPDGALLREWWEESDFDPRERPWFKGAVAQARDTPAASQSPYWTPPYRFYTSGQIGVTVATRVPWDRAVDAVVYFDVTLNDLDEFVRESKPSPNGFSLVVNDNLDVLGWPGIDALSRERVLAGDKAVAVAAEKLPLLAEALQYWREQGSPDQVLDRIRREGQRIWVGLGSLQVTGEKFHVLVAVPEDDFLGEARKGQQRMALVLFAGLAGVVGLAFWLAALYTRPIGLLVSRSAAMERLEWSGQEAVISRVREVQRLAGAQERMSTALESFSRYVPRDVIAELLRQGEAARISAHPAELTVLFTDIRSFTRLSEHLPPDDVARYLSEYFDVLHRIIARHQGTTDKYIGDALMAFWGAPRADAHHALNAVRAVLECRATLAELNQQWRRDGRPEFHTTFGLATGPVVVGNVGARDRLNYTVLGNTVNVASRCVGLGRRLGCSILALDSVAGATSSAIEWRRLGPVEVRGIREAKMVCEPLGVCGQTPLEAIAFRTAYEEALDAYLAKDIMGAMKRLEQLAAARPDELSVNHLVGRCQELLRKTPADLDTGMLTFH